MGGEPSYLIVNIMFREYSVQLLFKFIGRSLYFKDVLIRDSRNLLVSCFVGFFPGFGDLTRVNW